jgi:RNA polymerase sporulation-specific sigma factor
LVASHLLYYLAVFAFKYDKMLQYIDRLLSPREKQILMMRYGLGGIRARTQREIAQELGISRSYVSRIEKAALSEIADHISDYSV